MVFKKEKSPLESAFFYEKRQQKKFVPIVTEQITLSQYVSRNRETTKENEKPILQESLLKCLLYNTFVIFSMIEQIEMTIDVEIEVHDAINLLTKTTDHKTVIASHLETVIAMTETLLQNTHDHDMIIIK